MNNKAFFNWSSGKDSALALYRILESGQFEIGTLFTSINSDNQRVSMHGVNKTLLEKQSVSLNLPLEILELPGNLTMDEYNQLFQVKIDELKMKNMNTAIFGDIFLEDVKAYRIKQLSQAGLDYSFPLWGRSTSDIINEFLSLGFKTVVTCVDGSCLDESFVGRVIDRDFIKDLPEGVDICGENGEFHTFVFDGPIFSYPIDFVLGEKKSIEFPISEKETGFKNVKKSYQYWYCDLLAK